MEFRKIREFAVDLNANMVHQAVGLSDAQAQELSKKMGKLCGDVSSGRTENLAEIAKLIGECFTMEELVMNSMMFVAEKVEARLRERDRDDEDDDDEDEDDDLEIVL